MTDFSGYITSRTLPMLRKCSLCGAMRRTLYEVPVDGTVFLFCSVNEAKIGLENYEKNKHLATVTTTPLDDRSIIAEDMIRESTQNQP